MMSDLIRSVDKPLLAEVDSSALAKMRAMPKIELHRHFEGSVRLNTLVDIAREFHIEMPEYDEETIQPFVQMMPQEPRNWQHFLAKFKTLRQFYRSDEVIARISREIVEDAAKDNIAYMELRFTPMALSSVTHSSNDDIIKLVSTTAMQAAEDCGIQVGLIVSTNRHEGPEVAEKVLQSAVDCKVRGVVGVDLAGNEAKYPAHPFRTMFRDAKKEGLGITIHAGEWDGANSVWDAIGNIGADRIGHGIRVLEDPAIMSVLVEREIVLEVCPSSNYLSGVVDELESHPLPQLMRQRVQTTINTDDPLVCNIELSDEFALAAQHMNLTMDELKTNILCAARSAFLPPAQRDKLVSDFQVKLSQY